MPALHVHIALAVGTHVHRYLNCTARPAATCRLTPPAHCTCRRVLSEPDGPATRYIHPTPVGTSMPLSSTHTQRTHTLRTHHTHTPHTFQVSKMCCSSWQPETSARRCRHCRWVQSHSTPTFNTDNAIVCTTRYKLCRKRSSQTQTNRNNPYQAQSYHTRLCCLSQANRA